MFYNTNLAKSFDQWAPKELIASYIHQNLIQALNSWTSFHITVFNTEIFHVFLYFLLLPFFQILGIFACVTIVLNWDAVNLVPKE